MSEKLRQLEVEQSVILTRQKRRKAAEDRDRKRLREIERLIHRERILAVVGVEGAVKVAYRQRQGHPDAFLNDARGTVLEVRRTLAQVQWDTPCPRDGYNGQWQWHIDALMPTEQYQGCTLDALAAGDGLE